ncbi:MAG TPA: cupin domain-containing protein [Planctomycetaceae bacterium]|nr:cupin domain-containing protein [Planctomycetaceae bacterium]HQZ64769.1 cupin domain-containing protein [Planctomycetaceae bacterium]
MAHEHAKPGTVIDLNTFGEDKSTALVKETKFEVIRMIVEASKSIPPHKTDGPVTVQCLRGKCKFFVGEEPRELVPGSWLYMAGGTMHAIEAEETTVLLVTILFGKKD